MEKQIRKASENYPVIMVCGNAAEMESASIAENQLKLLYAKHKDPERRAEVSLCLKMKNKNYR